MSSLLSSKANALREFLRSSTPKGPLACSSLQTMGVLLIRVVTQAATLLLLTRLLGPQSYGSFAAAASLAVVLGLLPNLGAGYVLMTRASQDAGAAGDIWRYAWPLTTVLGALLLVIYVVAGYQLSAEAAFSWQVLLWLGLSELLITPFVMLLSFALQANERVPLGQFVQWIPLGLRALAILPCFSMEGDQRLQGYAVFQLIGAILGLAISLAITLRHVRLDWKPRYASIVELRSGATYAAMHLIAANPSELDKVLALRMLGTHSAGIYAASTRVMGALVLPVIAILVTAQPQLFRQSHTPSRQGRQLIVTIAALALAWGLLCWLLLVSLSESLPLLFGARFAEMADLMPWLAAVAAPLSLRLASGTVLVALGRPLERVCFELGGITALVAATLLLAPNFGVRGLAAALLASESCMAATGWWLVRRHLLRQQASPLCSGSDPKAT